MDGLLITEGTVTPTASTSSDTSRGWTSSSRTPEPQRVAGVAHAGAGLQTVEPSAASIPVGSVAYKAIRVSFIGTRLRPRHSRDLVESRKRLNPKRTAHPTTRADGA